MKDTKKTTKGAKKTTKGDIAIDPLVEKVEELENQLLEAQNKYEEAESAKLRALADLQNFQRRQGEEKAQWSSFAVGNFIKSFLPRFLELQMGIDHSKDEDAKKVVEKFFEELTKQGLEKVNPEPGTAVDTNLHEVLMQAEGAPGTVVQVLEPGWKFGETIIAPAKVSGAAA